MGDGTNTNGSEPLAQVDRERLSRLVAEQGEAVASDALGIPRHTLARLLAGLSVRAGTRALVAQGLARVCKVDDRKGAPRK